jgi:tungstate transport system permease protein
VLVTPIIAALARQTIEDLWIEYRDELDAMNVGPALRVRRNPTAVSQIFPKF